MLFRRVSEKWHASHHKWPAQSRDQTSIHAKKKRLILKELVVLRPLMISTYSVTREKHAKWFFKPPSLHVHDLHILTPVEFPQKGYLTQEKATLREELVVLERGIETKSSIGTQEYDEMHFKAIASRTDAMWTISFAWFFHQKMCNIARVRQGNGMVLDLVINMERTWMTYDGYTTIPEVDVYEERTLVPKLSAMHAPSACSMHKHHDENWWY